jgi:hypothetical protein
MSRIRLARSVFLAVATLAVPCLPLARAVPSRAHSSPGANGTAAAPPAIYVPASAHAGGANGADWRTDLEIHNAGTAATTATIALLVRDSANPSPQTRSVAVAAGTSVRLPDVLLGTFAFTGAAALRVTSDSSRLVVTSRTYNLVGPGAAGLPQGASFGQFVRGVPEEAAISRGQEARLIQLTQRDASSGLDFRTNIGFVNLTGATIEIQLDLYRADGTHLGTRTGSETRLRAFEFRQISEILKPYGTIADGYAVLRTTTPGGRFLAFATVIDNHLSGDPVFVPALATAPADGALPASGETWIPATAHASGMNGASWRTDLEVHNPGSVAAQYTVFLLPRDRDNSVPAGQRSFSLDPQKSVRYVDVLESVFGFTGAAALRIVPTSGTIQVTSRTYNLVGPNSAGLPVGASFSQFVPGFSAAEAIASTEEGRLVQLTQRTASSGLDFRTNVGVVNTTGSTVDVRLDFYRADGTWLGARQGEETRLTQHGFRQLSEAFATWGTVSDGYVVARPTTAGGRILAFATVIDNHVSGDPVFVPAARMAASAVPTPTPTPTPGATVVSGPGGTTMTLPPGTASSGASVALVAGDGSTLAKAGETLVSTVVKTSVSGDGIAIGNGSFTVTLPVTGSVSDPEKLLLKVAVSTGPVYPVAGVYDTAKKTFTAELMRVWNGWTMGVVTRPSLRTSTHERAAGVSSLGWVTPEEWETCAFRVFNHAPSASTDFVAGYTGAIERACEHLREAGFRSPRLWLDGRFSPKARAIHLVEGTGESDPSTSFCRKIDDESFSLAELTDDQMQALGQLYFNWDEWTSDIQPKGQSYDNVAIHELFHAVQTGYDIRERYFQEGGSKASTANALEEGTATLVGQQFQSNPLGINGGEVTVRSSESPAWLDTHLLYPIGEQAYAKQDFFAYVARRWNGGSLRDLKWLFQHLADATDGEWGRSEVEYYTLYRRAMDNHCKGASYGVTLPELYAEYARDRGYWNTPSAQLRDADRTRTPNSLNDSLFFAEEFDPEAGTILVIPDIWPLMTSAATVLVSDAARTAGKVELDITVEGAALSKEEVRIFVYPEKDGVLQAGTELEVTDLSRTVVVPVGSATSTLTVFITNGSIEHHVAKVTIGRNLARMSMGFTEVHYCNPPGCPDETPCQLGGDGEEPEWAGPLTWSGDSFRFTYPGTAIDVCLGELAPDRKSLLWFRLTGLVPYNSHWVNLPLDPARSVDGRLVFAVSGEAARDHIVVEQSCGSAYSFVDYSKTLKLEVWLGP